MQELVCVCCLFKFYRVRLENKYYWQHAHLLEVNSTNIFASLDENAQSSKHNCKYEWYLPEVLTFKTV